MFGEIRGGTHPHEVLLLIATCLLGAAGLVFYSVLATPVVRSLPYPFGHILYAGLVAGSGIAIWGVFWRSITGALVERVGLFSLSALALSYTAAIFAFAGWRGINFGGFMIAFSVANLIRAYQISQEIRELDAARVILRIDRPGEE
jgi:hypothetical protein